MSQSRQPGKRLVLVGGGHAHVLVLEDFAATPEPGLELVLVAKHLRTPYSGMLPGHVAGLYPRCAIEIDLPALAARAGATIVHGEATGYDVAARRVRLGSGEPVSYDI